MYIEHWAHYRQMWLLSGLMILGGKMKKQHLPPPVTVNCKWGCLELEANCQWDNQHGRNSMCNEDAVVVFDVAGSWRVGVCQRSTCVGGCWLTWRSTMGLEVVAVNESVVGVLFDGSCSKQLMRCPIWCSIVEPRRNGWRTTITRLCFRSPSYIPCTLEVLIASLYC